MGDISVRRRLEPTLKIDIYEVILGDEHLMSSIFTVAEIALARLGLAEVSGDDLDVVVGGLGLGYTARAALEAERSEEHTSELQSLMRISYDVFCLKKKNQNNNNTTLTQQ